MLVYINWFENLSLSNYNFLKMYELLGAAYIDEGRNVAKAIPYLQKALEIRERLEGIVQNDQGLGHPILTGTTYPYSMTLLAQMGQNRHLARLEAVRIRLENLSAGHPDTLYWILVNCAKVSSISSICNACVYVFAIATFLSHLCGYFSHPLHEQSYLNGYSYMRLYLYKYL